MCPVRLIYFALLVNFFYSSYAERTRVVVTFSNSTSGLAFIPANTTLVKKYGRRLVLDVTAHRDSQTAEFLKYLMLQAWGEGWTVIYVEDDLFISQVGMHNTNITEQILLASDIEWQYSNLEKYSTQAETAWQMNIVSKPSI